MKKKVLMMLLSGMLICSGCGAVKEPDIPEGIQAESHAPDVQKSVEDEAGKSAELQSGAAEKPQEIKDGKETASDAQQGTVEPNSAEGAAWEDYTAQIKGEIEGIVKKADSLDEELAAVAELEKRYADIATADIPQLAMNQAAQWPYVVWDTELNNLWSRISETFSAGEKEQVLPWQRAWNAQKEDIVEYAIGTAEEGGSMYPVLYYGQMKQLTKNRCYQLANLLADHDRIPFTLPKREIAGAYADEDSDYNMQGYLIIMQGYEKGSYDVVISAGGKDRLTGYAEAVEDGKFTFVSDDGNVTAVVEYSIAGAYVTIEKSNGGQYAAGEQLEFGMAL